ncbi:MAG: hypothetical protein V1738_02890 [Patescibacteria group bacterium]
MQEIMAILSVLQPVSFVAFLVAFVTMIFANRAIKRQNFGQARVLTFASAIAGTLVLVVNVLAFGLTLAPITGIMCLVWGYYSYYSWRQYRQLRE